MGVPVRIAAFWLLFGWAVAILVLVLADIFPQPVGGGPRLRTEVPAIGRTVNTGARLSRSLIEGLSSSNRTDEQKGWLKDTGGEEDQGEGRGAEEGQGEARGGKGTAQRRETGAKSASAPRSGSATNQAGGDRGSVCHVRLVQFVRHRYFRCHGRAFRNGEWCHQLPGQYWGLA